MLHEVSFKSFNERDTVYGWIYVPAAKPIGIVQLVHGFGEHSRRYLHMIVKLMGAGFIVAADDHVGHGKTALENDTWGDWGDKGVHTMMEDEHKLTQIVKEKYPNLPYFLYGHSMGSFIARDYISKYGAELNGVVLCGAMLLGWMFARCDEGVKLGNEWICHDPYVQIDHAEDPFDAFTKPTSNSAWLDFCYMVDIITGPDWAKKVPNNLPVYNIAGDQDPVGQYGTGVYQVSNWLTDSGNDVTTKLYSGYRHEIHNYACLRDEVVDGMIDFFNKHI